MLIGDVKFVKKGPLCLLYIGMPFLPSLLIWLQDPGLATNHFLVQCNGVVIDVKEEEVVFFPLCHTLQLQKLPKPDWPVDNVDIPEYKTVYGK